MSKARELAELSRTVSDSADAVAITIDSSEDVSFSEDIKLGDGKKAIFGAGSDLQIYHDGSNSYLEDTGTGALFLKTNGAGAYIYSGSEALATFNLNGANNFYYDNALKLSTTATGIDVTGTVTADDFTVGSTSDSQSLIQMLANSTNGANTIHFGDGASADAYRGYINYAHDSDSLQFAAAGSERMRISGSNLGLGTQSPNSYGGYSTLTINGTTAGLIDLEANGTLKGEVYAEAGGLGLQAVGATNITFKTNYTERFKIDSGGALTGTCFNASTGEYSGNLNDLKKTGFYRSENSNTNNPSYAYYSVVVYGNQGNVTAQIATLLSGPATYVRSFNTSWTSWVRIDD